MRKEWEENPYQDNFLNMRKNNCGLLSLLSFAKYGAKVVLD